MTAPLVQATPRPGGQRGPGCERPSFRAGHLQPAGHMMPRRQLCGSANLRTLPYTGWCPSATPPASRPPQIAVRGHERVADRQRLSGFSAGLPNYQNLTSLTPRTSSRPRMQLAFCLCHHRHQQNNVADRAHGKAPADLAGAHVLVRNFRSCYAASAADRVSFNQIDAYRIIGPISPAIR